MRRSAIALLAAILMADLAPAGLLAATTRPACPNVGLRSVPAVLITVSGRHRYRLEVAATDAQQQCGLMFRKTMPRRTGMVFRFDPPRAASFWMENTPLPLDLIFVGADSRVISIGAGKPFSRDLIDSGGIAASVIELNAGEARRIGLQPGDRVER